MTLQGSQQQQLLDEASEWLVQLCSGERTEAQEQAFALWLGSSQAHRDAFDSVESLWQDLAVVAHFPEEGAAPQLPEAANDEGGNIKRRALLGSAAAALLATTLYFSPFASQDSPETLSYRTDIGEQQQIELADGSNIYLNTATRVSVSYSSEQREITLEQGEAYFDVATDAERPFVVMIPNGSVTALGTAFNIHLRKDRTDVTVTEGVVKVKEPAGSYGPAASAIVRANQAITVSTSEPLGAARSIDPTAITAWTEKKLIFQDASLKEVISALNRYSKHSIRISDPAIASRKVSGVFHLDQPQAMLKGIEASLGLAHEQRGDLIMLYQSKTL
jgi:transmembrane sensor